MQYSQVKSIVKCVLEVHEKLELNYKYNVRLVNHKAPIHHIKLQVFSSNCFRDMNLERISS